jgi:hypothetical protein
MGELMEGFLMGIFDWVPLTLLLAVGALPEQLSALRTLYIGFRKAKLKKAKENMGQCKSED